MIMALRNQKKPRSVSPIAAKLIRAAAVIAPTTATSRRRSELSRTAEIIACVSRSVNATIPRTPVRSQT